MYGYDYDTITTSSDTESLRAGDTVYGIFEDGTELKGRILAVEVDGDLDDEGRAFGYTIASAEFDDGRAFSIDARGFGHFPRGRAANGGWLPETPEFHTQAQPNAYYDA